MDARSPLYPYSTHYEDDDEDWESVSSTGEWGHPKLVHGDQLFQAMGEVYAAKRLREMGNDELRRATRGVAGRDVGALGWDRPVAREAQPQSPEQHHRWFQNVYENHNSATRGSVHPDMEMERERAMTVTKPPGEMQTRDISQQESVSDLAASILNYDKPNDVALPRPRSVPSDGRTASIDGELYRKLSPEGMLIRGTTLPEGVRPAHDTDVDGFRAQLRQEFWKEFMQSYDKRCATTYNPKLAKNVKNNAAVGPPKPFVQARY